MKASDCARLCPLTTHHDITTHNVVLQSDLTAAIVEEWDQLECTDPACNGFRACYTRMERLA